LITYWSIKRSSKMWYTSCHNCWTYQSSLCGHFAFFYKKIWNSFHEKFNHVDFQFSWNPWHFCWKLFHHDDCSWVTVCEFRGSHDSELLIVYLGVTLKQYVPSRH
jgi:hypothetical protein